MDEIVPNTVISAGVSIGRYDIAGALAAVSQKSFSCTMCGKCCTMAADAEVWINAAELDRIAAYLGVSPEAFTSSYCQQYDQVPGWRLLQSAVTSAHQLQQQQQQQHHHHHHHHHQQQHQHEAKEIDVHMSTYAYKQQQQQQHGAFTAADAPSLQIACIFLDPATNSCTIRPVRPLQCSTYPWWPELMPLRNWQQEKVLMCEGLDHPDAPPLNRWEAAQQLQQATDHALLLEAAKPKGWRVEQLYDQH
eukprot:gene9129-biopygen11021